MFYFLDIYQQINKHTIFAVNNLCIIGIRYAPVLPEPVRARVIISFPSSANGMNFACTNVGRAHPDSAIPYKQINVADKMRQNNHL
jgi:hypothetical protein